MGTKICTFVYTLCAEILASNLGYLNAQFDAAGILFQKALDFFPRNEI